MRSTFLGCAALIGGILMSTTWAAAMPASVNDISIDVPDGYVVETSSRGVLARTPDGDVDIWVETYLPADRDAIIGEHAKYWRDNRVEFEGRSVSTTTDGDVKVDTTKFSRATWKGAPTVLRYVGVGPIGPKKEMVLITYWASPQADKDQYAQFQNIVDTLKVDVAH